MMREPQSAADTVGVRDARNRPLHDLRISVTDRCNFRCVYCMPRDIFGADYAFLPKSALLSFDEILRVARAAVSLGVEKIRLTGGEPLLRPGLEELIARLAELRTPGGGPLDLALTTNGAALRLKAQSLKDAGLTRVSVSLDSLDPERFQRIADVRIPLSAVLDGITAAAEAGLGPIKVNTVITRGINDDEIVSLAEHFRGTGQILRFIEFMDVGNTNGWNLDAVVPSAEIVRRISDVYPLEPSAPTREGETASRWRYLDGAGEIGVISSVSQAFCGTCSRARLSAEGKLFTCLFATEGVDLRAILRNSTGDDAVREALAGTWGRRADRYSELRSTINASTRPRIEMSYIGG